MRLLHLGSGFRPLRRGGLVAYVEDLMAEQVRRHHEVSYFFSGRYYPFVNGPRLRRWESNGVAMLEVVNSPLYDHGRQPRLELSEPRIENMLDKVLRELKPDVVHVQELAGLPSSLLDVAHRAGVPTVMMLQDYFPLCSTFKLLDADGRVCLRREIGADCAATTAANPTYPGLLFEATLRHDLPRLPLVRRIGRAKHDRRLIALAELLAKRATENGLAGVANGAQTPEAFQRRREVNVERLNRADRLIAMSTRVQEIYELLGVHPEQLQTLELTLSHIERLRPRTPSSRGPVSFATLGGLESTAKGARVLLDAMGSLAPTEGRLRLLVFGHVDPKVVEEATRLPGVELMGPFSPTELDTRLDQVDVGIMPSVWEEAYGYAGMEFLAKGIPVIANEIGGIVDYVREGETGWLNRSCSAEGLARIMARLADDPEQVVALNAYLRTNRESIVKPMARHGEEMDAVYGSLLSTR